MQTRMSEQQMALLADIFRIIVKEITCDEDKYLLAPGELGINYEEGSFYIKNPHTGELFSPNSLEHLRQILSKFDDRTGTLNADYVNGLRVYTDINQLSRLGTNISIDTVIREMEYPGFLMSSVEYESYKMYGYPSESGMLTILKVSPDFVFALYYDNLGMTTYEGRYNSFKHTFEGWITKDSQAEFIETEGGGNRAKIHTNNPVTDMTVLTVRVTEDLFAGAEISINDGEYVPIIKPDGTPLESTIIANKIIMLIYDSQQTVLVLSDSGESSIIAIVKIMEKRVEKVQSDLQLAIQDYRERVNQLRTYVDQQVTTLKTRPGTISSVISTLEITENNVDTISAVTGFDPRYDKLIINFNQTILRQGIDYSIETSGSIVFTKIRFNIGDQLQFIVLKQAPTENI